MVTAGHKFVLIESIMSPRTTVWCEPVLFSWLFLIFQFIGSYGKMNCLPKISTGTEVAHELLAKDTDAEATKKFSTPNWLKVVKKPAPVT